MKILFLSRWFPYPITNGSKLRIQNLLQGLAKRHDITLISFTNQHNFKPNRDELNSICSDVQTIPWQGFNPQSWRARYGFFSKSPRFILDTYSNQMDQVIRRSISEAKYDVVITSQLSMASYYLSFKGTPAIFEELELGLFHSQTVNPKSMLKRLRNKLTWLKLRGYVSSILDHYQACTVVSEQEMVIFKDNFPEFKKEVEIIPNCVRLEDYQDTKITPVSHQLVFTGPFRYPVNYDAMVWFIRDVFPLVLDCLPETKLVISGDHGNLPLPSQKNIILTGHVDDIKSLIASSTVSIAPLLNGGGTRLKVLEAMALGTPIVATSKGAEGLDAQNNIHFLIADSPQDFANSVIRLLEDKKLREQLARNAKDLIKEKYDWSSIMPRYLRMIERISTK